MIRARNRPKRSSSTSLIPLKPLARNGDVIVVPEKVVRPAGNEPVGSHAKSAKAQGPVVIKRLDPRRHRGVR